LAVPMSDFCFQSMQTCILIGFFKENLGHIPFNKNSGLKFRKFHVPNGTVQLCTFQLHKRDPSHCIFAHCPCKQQFCEMEKGQFSPTDQNDQTSQRGPSSKPVPTNVNRNGPFHLMYQTKCTEFWVEWKAPLDFHLTYLIRVEPLPEPPLQKRLGGYAPVKR